MGNRTSKKTTETSSSSAINVSSSLHCSTELTSYEAACKLNTELQTFDTNVQARTNQVIDSLAVGVEVRALSFDSLRDVTECLLEMNQEVIRVILECKKDIWKSLELFELVEEYFENSLKALDFCSSLEKCLKRVRDRQLLILVALQQFNQESVNGGGDGGEIKYTRTLEELKNFKEAGDPFTEEFFRIFQSVYRQQMTMLEKYQLRKNKLNKKIKYIHAWRKITSMIFVTTFAAVLICSIVATAMAAPPVAAALAAATSIPLGSTGKWIDSLWKNYQNTLKGQKEVISLMQVGTYVAIKDLNSIRVLVDRLEIEIESMLKTADFAVQEEAVKIRVDEIKKKLEIFMKNVEKVGQQADICSRDIRRARTVVLQRIINHPNNS
ncbi:UPF0496 protein 1 [Hibiscus syriacus]|uniref:UPF0496 protein 1 n=1 Tax=Hibiscus syriacus TaxID=106335 RepID=A0A6A3BIA8_HIBSY|nr:UPF0496 protein At4g34320-like [Hibiscus syriacus]KAE8716756.1 UPF0496 protein 1 [Hibiscus syriacus]